MLFDYTEHPKPMYGLSMQFENLPDYPGFADFPKKKKNLEK